MTATAVSMSFFHERSTGLDTVKESKKGSKRIYERMCATDFDMDETEIGKKRMCTYLPPPKRQLSVRSYFHARIFSFCNVFKNLKLGELEGDEKVVDEVWKIFSSGVIHLVDHTFDAFKGVSPNEIASVHGPMFINAEHVCDIGCRPPQIPPCNGKSILAASGWCAKKYKEVIRREDSSFEGANFALWKGACEIAGKIENNEVKKKAEEELAKGKSARQVIIAACKESMKNYCKITNAVELALRDRAIFHTSSRPLDLCQKLVNFEEKEIGALKTLPPYVLGCYFVCTKRLMDDAGDEVEIDHFWKCMGTFGLGGLFASEVPRDYLLDYFPRELCDLIPTISSVRTNWSTSV